MSARSLAVTLALAGAAAVGLTAPAAAGRAQDDPVSYWRQVRPLLQTRCAGCHQSAAECATRHRETMAQVGLGFGRAQRHEVVARGDALGELAQFGLGEHVHPAIEESFTVVRGRVGFRIDERESIAEPDQRLHVP